MEVMFGNTTVALTDRPLERGSTAPDFTVINTQFQTVTLSDFTREFVVISVVPSLDTGVCDYQTRTFNERLGHLADVDVITLSVDLPFAQKRWCGQSGLDHVVTLSDHRDLDFGRKYGVLMAPLRLLARAVFVLDQSRTIVYREYVRNVSDHPSYDEVVKLLESYR